MPQKLYAVSATRTATTSFIVSSDESLNRRPLSLSRSSDGSSIDSMATSAATASSSSQNNNHQSYFGATASLNPMAFNQSSESSVSSGSYSSSTANYLPVANCQVDLPAPTSATQLSNVSPIQCLASGPQQQHSSQRFGSAPKQSSDNSRNEHYGTNFKDMQHQLHAKDIRFVDEPNLNSDFSPHNGLLSVESQGQCSKRTNYACTQNIRNNNNNNCLTSAIPVKSSFQQHSPNNQRSNLDLGIIESQSSNSLMPINVKGMILNGVASDEVLRSWLISIKCDEYLRNFLDHGYDMHLLTRMTPQDLTAIGCKSPNLRKKFLIEIKKLNLEDDIPNSRPNNLAQWLEELKLSDYYGQLCREGYDNIEKVCQLTWEDLEEIGISKLGHQKRLLLGIERVQKQSKQSEEELAIYDVHPNHRISLHPRMSDKRLSRSTVRSGFFTTKSGNLDNRGVPVATVIPALKHVSNSLANLDISRQTITNVECLNGNNNKIYSNENDRTRKSIQSITSQSNQICYQEQQQQAMKMNDFSGSVGTMKRPPPLPPVRTNSLKIAHDQQNQVDCSSNIYDNTYGSYSAGSNSNTTLGYSTMTSTSNSFLRTPKLGTLTATTNKMLSHNGHIQTISAQVPVMKSVPIREAPHPPTQAPTQPPPPPPTHIGCQSTSGDKPAKAEQELAMNPLMNSPLVGHQIVSADEFPPPPPPPQ